MSKSLTLAYHNLKAHPNVEIEVGNETIDTRAEEITGPERDRLYARQASLYPQFAQYQRQTKRIIPVIALTPRPDDSSQNSIIPASCFRSDLSSNPSLR